MSFRSRYRSRHGPHHLFFFIVTVILLAVSIFTFSFSDLVASKFYLDELFVPAGAAFVALACVIVLFLIFNYEIEFLFRSIFATARVVKEESRAEEKIIRSSIDNRIEKLESELSNYRDEFERKGNYISSFDIELFKNEILSQLNPENFDEKSAEEIRVSASSRAMRSIFDEIKENLIDYRRSNRFQFAINLSISAMLTGSAIIVAIFLLGSRDAEVLLTSQGGVTIIGVIAFYVPWITLIIILQIMAIFFLRLYKENIRTERYLRDEITSVYFRIAGIESSIKIGQITFSKEVAETLLSTNRHTVLLSGQTTIELEKIKHDHEAIKEGMELFSSTIPWEVLRAIGAERRGDGDQRNG